MYQPPHPWSSKSIKTLNGCNSEEIVSKGAKGEMKSFFKRKLFILCKNGFQLAITKHERCKQPIVEIYVKFDFYRQNFNLQKVECCTSIYNGWLLNAEPAFSNLKFLNKLEVFDKTNCYLKTGWGESNVQRRSSIVNCCSENIRPIIYP